MGLPSCSSSPVWSARASALAAYIPGFLDFLSFWTMPLYLCICLGCSSPDFFTHQTPVELSRPGLAATSFVELHGSSGQWVILSSDVAVFPPFINNTCLPHCPVIIWTPGPDRISPIWPWAPLDHDHNTVILFCFEVCGERETGYIYIRASHAKRGLSIIGKESNKRARTL